MAANPKYKGKVNFVLVNMGSLDQAEEYTKKQGLAGNCIHGHGQPHSDYAIQYIPHKVLIGKDGLVLKNFDVKLPDDLEECLE